MDLKTILRSPKNLDIVSNKITKTYGSSPPKNVILILMDQFLLSDYEIMIPRIEYNGNVIAAINDAFVHYVIRHPINFHTEKKKIQSLENPFYSVQEKAGPNNVKLSPVAKEYYKEAGKGPRQIFRKQESPKMTYETRNPDYIPFNYAETVLHSDMSVFNDKPVEKVTVPFSRNGIMGHPMNPIQTFSAPDAFQNDSLGMVFRPFI